MDAIARFLRQPSRRYRDFQIAFALLTANFILPSLSYAIAPATAYRGFLQIGDLFWHATYPKSEDSYYWRFLGASNVFTLGTMCFLLQLDLRRYYPVLPPLLVLKAGTALQFLVHFAFVLHYPGFLAIGLFDTLTCGAFLYFAIRAHRDAEARGWKDLVPAPRGLARAAR